MRYVAVAFLLVLAPVALAQLNQLDCAEELGADSYQPHVYAPGTCKCGDEANLQAFSDAQLQAWADEARDEVRTAFVTGRLAAREYPARLCWQTHVAVVLTSCDWYQGHTYWYDATLGRIVSGSTCAAGTSDYGLYRVVVSTRDVTRVKALVMNEARNVWLRWLARCDLIDQWSPSLHDPLADELQPRRRAVQP